MSDSHASLPQTSERKQKAKTITRERLLKERSAEEDETGVGRGSGHGLRRDDPRHRRLKAISAGKRHGGGRRGEGEEEGGEELQVDQLRLRRVQRLLKSAMAVGLDGFCGKCGSRINVQEVRKSPGAGDRAEGEEVEGQRHRAAYRLLQFCVTSRRDRPDLKIWGSDGADGRV